MPACTSAMADSRLWPSFHYPAVVGLAFAQFIGYRWCGLSLTVSTYVPIVVTALFVAAMETRWPNRADWRPSSHDLRTDALFLAAVQLALPPLVALTFSTAVVEPVRHWGLPAAGLWPHEWHVAAQAALMVILVDLMRYWLHRLAHETDLLWRLHAVHHSVDRLYWLNTSRFHPLEKTLQMCADSLPFLVMGVQPTVLSLYYLAYSANGFFQHSNINLRYGVLNYIVSGAEAHRWHHSREPREANSNYGSTTILWDLVFGTFFLPRDRSVTDLGLHDRQFPQGFWAQLRAPFGRR
jgi:sterol desaturase/sphingolipid hydroxylase (fatty acid hydroxylase superfamily)